MKPIKRNHLLIPSRWEGYFEERALERYQRKNRKRLKNYNFTILANSCVGAQIYRDLNLRFDTPLVGLYITPEDFIVLLEDFDNLIKREIVEIKTNLSFPVGMLAGKIKIFFRSDKTFDEAIDKWKRRIERIHFDNIFVFMNPLEQDFGLDQNFKTHICSTETIQKFNELKFKNKVVLTNKKRLVIADNCVYMRRYQCYEYPPYIGIISCLSGKRIFDRYFDVVHWLNTGEIKKRRIHL